jgi:hypothetical protein
MEGYKEGLNHCESVALQVVTQSVKKNSMEIHVVAT